jgi:MSHA biogenesis protein MshL
VFKKNRLLSCLTYLLVIALSGCAHQSKIKPSTGHIDAKVEAKAVDQTATSNAPQATEVPQADIPKPVKPQTKLPPPSAGGKVQTYSVVVNEVPVKEILFALARESKLNVDIDPAIQGRVTLNAVDQTLPAILERLARQVDLTYRMDGNVLIITPDQPVLRTYKVDYVNMNRDTKGFIGAAAEISSTGQSATTSGSGQTSVTSTSGNGANNSSRTSVTSESKNHLWESLIDNIKELLAETDKEVIVSRFGTLGDDQVNDDMKSDTKKSEQDTNKAKVDQREEQRSEYKTLFAANVIANPETGVISVRATNKQHQKVQEFIDKVMGSAGKQVLIEATIVEVQLSDSFKTGIDWSRLGNTATSSGFTFSQQLNSGDFSPGTINTRGTGDGLTVGYFNPAGVLGNIAASINLLKKFGDTKVLSSPKLMVLNNQTAVLKVVDNLVYFTVQAQQSTIGGSVGGTLNSITTTPNTVPVGIVMSVTPQINDTGNVNINVRPTISSLIRYVPDPNPNITAINNQGIPEIQVREMESLLQVASGNTAVLGGLMQDVIIRKSDKVPGLSDVPAVGNVFKGKDDSTKKTELVIFLRPTVIPNASLESDELQSFKQYLPAQQLQNVLDEANQ